VTAIRTARAAEGKFVQISNAAMRDRRLSGLARAIIALALSMPPDQHLTATWFEGQFPEGRRRVVAALHELEACGYYRKTKTSSGGTWIWEQVISDAPLPVADAAGAASSQVAASDRFASDASASDANRSNKGSNTARANTENKKMASRRAHASSVSEPRTILTAIRDVRSAVAEVHGEREAAELSDDDALGLWARYAGRQKVRDLAAYMVKIVGDAPHLDTLLANSAPVCTGCVQYYENCRCEAA
jgi:hypothetical protein